MISISRVHANQRVQLASISTWVSLSTFAWWQFHYYLLGDDTVVPSGLYARLCHAFLVFTSESQFRYLFT